MSDEKQPRPEIRFGDIVGSAARGISKFLVGLLAVTGWSFVLLAAIAAWYYSKTLEGGGYEDPFTAMAHARTVQFALIAAASLTLASLANRGARRL